jgi:hypothetical protein
VHDGVDAGVGDDLGDEGVADVGAHELGAAHPAQQVARGRDGVDAQDPVDVRVGGQPRGEVPAEEPADAGDEHDGWRHGPTSDA